jgi:predicted nucleic acid-binding protein
MLLDANLLLYAVHERATQHEAASSWLTEQLNGPRRVGLPWQSLSAFLRIATHPRAFERPLRPSVAWERVSDWLAAPAALIPRPRPG